MRLPYTVEEGCFCHKIFTLEKLDIQFCQARLNGAMGRVVLLIKKRKINFIANQSIKGNVLISTPEHVHVISFLRPWHEGSVRIFNGVSRRSASNALKPHREMLTISGNNPPGPPGRKAAGRKCTLTQEIVEKWK